MGCLRLRQRVLLAAITAGLGLGPLPVQALELKGRTYFSEPPWKVDLVSYYTTVWQPWAQYYFSVELSPAAGAALGGLTIQQTRGVDRNFNFSVERTRAFLGRPRREGQPVPVQASFDPDARQFTIRFPEPVPPGNTVTVVLKPWTNPGRSDTYMFQVMAFPAGENPSPAPLGFGTLRIYEPDWR
jgi:hypothetical protein